jgi:DNA replication and repair protein RecF
VVSLSDLEIELQYVKGWPQNTTLLQALADSRARDQGRALTHVGPHRADVLLRLNGRPAREILSRGQQKLVAIAMTLSQLQLLAALSATVPTLLLDDPAAELDGEHLRKFIDQVNQLRCQLILTSLQAESAIFSGPEKVFHVEQGRVGPV